MRACNHCGSMEINTGFTCQKCGKSAHDSDLPMTTETPAADIVERLRETRKRGVFDAIAQGVYASADEAADEITRLRVRVDELLAYNNDQVEQRREMRRQRDELQRKLDEAVRAADRLALDMRSYVYDVQPGRRIQMLDKYDAAITSIRGEA